MRTDEENGVILSGHVTNA